MLQIKNLSFDVAGKNIQKELNFELEEGKIYHLKGKNGVGKTSLFEVIMGLKKVKQIMGEIWFDQTQMDVLDINQRSKLGIGLMYQNPPKFESLTLQKLIKYIGSNSDAMQKLLFELQILDLWERPLNHFSGGESKRSELAQILYLKPKLLLLDEPDSGVDLQNIKLMSKVLSKYAIENQVTMLITSHNEAILEDLNISKTIELKPIN